MFMPVIKVTEYETNVFKSPYSPMSANYNHDVHLYPVGIKFNIQSILDISNSDISNSANSKRLSESKIHFDCFL